MIRLRRVAHQGKGGISSSEQQSESGAAFTGVSRRVSHGMYAPDIAPDPSLCKEVFLLIEPQTISSSALSCSPQ